MLTKHCFHSLGKGNGNGNGKCKGSGEVQLKGKVKVKVEESFTNVATQCTISLAHLEVV